MILASKAGDISLCRPGAALAADLIMPFARDVILSKAKDLLFSAVARQLDSIEQPQHRPIMLLSQRTTTVSNTNAGPYRTGVDLCAELKAFSSPAPATPVRPRQRRHC